MKATVTCSAIVLLSAAGAPGQDVFVNWESPHVSPVDLTPDGSRLLAVNTADNRLEVFSVQAGGLSPIGAVPVGVDPVSVRARTDNEVWVVNAISDTVSIVDLNTLNVVATIYPGDEPADVVFAGDPQRAFVSVSQLNQVKVYDPLNLSAPPVVLDIEGEDPRALATDGTSVYVAVFEGGNLTTILGESVVASSVNPYPGDPSPPPNDGSGFNPPINPDNPSAPPDVSHIVKRDDQGAWRDDNGADWSAAVGWDLHDHDVAIVDAETLAVSYVTGLMNANMALGTRPGQAGAGTAQVTVVGTESINEVRFEPNLNGIFLRVVGATISGPGDGSASVVDLNPHLDYSTPSVGQAVRDQSLGDPRGVAWTADANRAFISGMGSNNVVVVDGTLGRAGLIEVGQGPTGVRYDQAHDRVYVLNKFEGSVSVIDAAGLTEEARVAFHDPTPDEIRSGRPFLYDTHRTSGLGQASCASCHIDGRMDQLAWDLGDPGGLDKPFNQTCNGGVFGGCEDWHPMKGPMATQTLVGIITTEPLHWRGDREDVPAFNGAFETLLGDDEQLTGPEMDQFVAFIATLTPPPNPFRELGGSLPTTFSNAGNPQTGENLYLTGNLDGVNCVTCHALPTGTNGDITSANLLQEAQSMKVPQLRNMYEKTGFDATSSSNNRGFGYIHDGSVDTLFNFLQFPGFNFAGGETGNQQRRDVAAFMMCFATDTHAGVGAQVTLPAAEAAGQPADVTELIDLAEAGVVGLVVKGVVSGEQRGWYLSAPGTYQSDRAAEIEDEQTLLGLAGPGSELTFTLVVAGSEQRLGVERDGDGFYDRDELDAGSDPADPDSTPDNVLVGDIDGDGVVGVNDFLQLLAAWGSCPDPCPPAACPADLDGDCAVGITDFLVLLANWS